MRELNKISKNIFVLIFIMVIALVIAMTPFQKESAHALLPSSSNMRSSIDYSGQGTIINGKTTGDPAYTTTRSINGSNQQVVAVPIYQGGYKVKGLWSSRSDWKVKGASTNITNRFATSSGVMYYYQFETKTQYEWNRKGKKKWSFSRPVAVFPMYQKTGKTRTMYRYRTKKAVWDSELSKTVEYVPLNYSLFKQSGSINKEPIALAIKYEYSKREQTFLTINNEKLTSYYITNKELADLLLTEIESLEDSIGIFSRYFKAGEAISVIIAAIKGGAKVAGPMAFLFACLEINDIFRSYLRDKEINNSQDLLEAIYKGPSFVFTISHYYSSTTTNTLINGSVTSTILNQNISTYNKTYVKLPNINGNVSYINNQQEIINAVISYLKYKNMPFLPWNW